MGGYRTHLNNIYFFMRAKIDCFLTGVEQSISEGNAAQIHYDKVVNKTIILDTPQIASSETLLKIAEKAEARYTLLVTKARPIIMGQSATERMLRAA